MLVLGVLPRMVGLSFRLIKELKGKRMEVYFRSSFYMSINGVGGDVNYARSRFIASNVGCVF